VEPTGSRSKEANLLRVRVDLIPEGMKELTVPRGTIIEHLLHMLKLNPEEVIVLRGEEPITEDEEIVDDDCLRIIRVVSGG